MTERLTEWLAALWGSADSPQSVVFGRRLRRMRPNMVRGLSGAPSSGGTLVVASLSVKVLSR